MKPQPFLIYSSLTLGPSQKLSRTPSPFLRGLGRAPCLKSAAIQKAFFMSNLGRWMVGWRLGRKATELLEKQGILYRCM